MDRQIFLFTSKRPDGVSMYTSGGLKGYSDGSCSSDKREQVSA